MRFVWDSYRTPHGLLSFAAVRYGLGLSSNLVFSADTEGFSRTTKTFCSSLLKPQGLEWNKATGGVLGVRASGNARLMAEDMFGRFEGAPKVRNRMGDTDPNMMGLNLG